MAKLTVALALVDIVAHGVAAGQLIEADAATLKSLCDSGQADPHKDAIAYARSQNALVVRSAIELAAERVAAAADALRVEIAKLEDLLAKAEGDETKAALATELAAQRAALAAVA
jgi:hypothetical protein